MKLLPVLLILFSCAHRSPETHQDNGEDLVTLNTALLQAQASYLKGCVDAMKTLKVPVAFPGCRDMALIHRRELQEIMDQVIE